MLTQIGKYCTGLIQTPLSEPYELVVRSSFDKWFSVGPDQVLLRTFSVDTIRTITDVLGHTVALEHFEREVESMLVQFSNLNADVASKGERFFQSSKTDLYKVIANNNKVLTDVIVTMNLLDRPETAWQYSTQSDLWDALRTEFEIVDRFKAVDFKLNLVSQNCQFFLNVLHSQRSNRLEVVIIVLISFEVVLGLYSIFADRKH
eukprot:c19966_g1_i1.p2 GENE.c19966_g1_i1~~c19966_g1_i1.p2  ORF type:complete len:204 (+),score=58.83 c19966_g1_i1:1100-1711(+)